MHSSHNQNPSSPEHLNLFDLLFNLFDFLLDFFFSSVFDGRHAFRSKLLELGYDIDGKEFDDLFWNFKSAAEKKKVLHKLARRLKMMGGSHYMFLTHREDIADHMKWSKRLSSDRQFPFN